MATSGQRFDSQLPEISTRYRLTERIGEGATGTVYLGERTDFPKRVAVKVLHAVVPEGLEEVSGESGLLSLLDHPNIVRLLEHGVSKDGRRFLVMEYVEGLALDAYADGQRLTVDARVALLIKAMEAVSHAHRHLVVHADLKPSNLLVDGSGEPMLLDFGIGALVAESGASESTAWTPAYASPEQREHGTVAIASDVYALGVLATLLLAGCLPVGDGGASPLASRLLRRREGADVKAIALARSTSSSGLRRALAGDLDAILAKALQREPSARYLSVELFADDLKAHLGGLPVAAQRWSRSYLLERWVQRHRTVAVIAALLLVVTSGSVAGVTMQAVRATRQRRAAVARLHEIVRLTGALEGDLYDSVHVLPQGDVASNSLLQAATSSLDSLAREDRSDSALSVEIAQQYGKLATLQVGQSRGAVAASADLQKGIDLLRGVPSSDRNYAAAQAEIAAMRGMRAH